MVGVIDYGGGNIQSVRNALRALGHTFREISAPEHFQGVKTLLFPGQGAFADSMHGLEARGVVPLLKEWLHADKPFLGICIGYQLLFESSAENPGVAGLGILKGQVVRFAEQPGLKIPHMGWNTATVLSEDAAIWGNLGPEPFFYFVHSYFPQVQDLAVVATTTHYGGQDFVSSVARGNLLATQFHPEKSQKNGLGLIGNFLAKYAAPSF
jgi:imidazole glycerol phosphate synthase glutamine amidotransferase subunit